MADKLGVYECGVCGNLVEVFRSGSGELVCCGQPMLLKQERFEDTGAEKHVPVVERIDDGYKVTVGSTPHPMEEEHHIEWIEIQFDSKVGRKFLKPGEDPVAVFRGIDEDKVIAREHCNVHGLWKGSN